MMAPEHLALGETTGLRYGDRVAPTLVLAHGAGAGQTHPFMVRMASGLATRGLCVVTFDFYYRAQGRRAPDRMPILQGCFRDVLDRCRVPGVRTTIGGKSMGGRVASMVAAEDAAIAEALVFLGYPLHPPGQPQKLRAAHLSRVAAPMFFVQGERDPFGTPDELAPILRDLPRASLLTIAGGDHSLAVPKRVRAQAEVDAEVMDAVAAFVRPAGQGEATPR
jgi:predicted alpha/beta-hydrolase family hydrolase